MLELGRLDKCRAPISSRILFHELHAMAGGFVLGSGWLVTSLLGKNESLSAHLDDIVEQDSASSARCDGHPIDESSVCGIQILYKNTAASDMESAMHSTDLPVGFEADVSFDAPERHPIS